MELHDSISLIFFALALIYGVVVILAMLRIVKVHRFDSKWRQTKVFYAAVLAQTFIRLSFFLVIFVRLDFLNEKVLFLLLCIPESLFILCYFLLVWQFLAVYHYAHVDGSSSQALIGSSKKGEAISKLGMLIASFWVALQTCLIVVYCAGAIGDQELLEEIGITNLILPVVAFMIMAASHFKFSGQPVISDEWRRRLNRISAVTVFWSAMRLFRGTISVSEGALDYSLTQEVSEDGTVSTTWFALTISYLIFSEVICFFLVIDYSFLCIFLFSEQQHVDLKEAHQNFKGQMKEIDVGSSVARRFSFVTNDRRLRESDIEIVEQLPSHSHMLGKSYRAKYKDRKVFYRRIEFTRLSNYVMEELSREIDELPMHDCDYLVPIIGVVIELPGLGIVTPMMSNGSLYDALHVTKRPFSLQEKLKIMRDVARCMTQLHESGMCHGHLSSHNVMLNEEWHGYVSDYGLAKVKKYAGLMLSYSNKNAWSSPEQLRERSITTMNVTQEDDIYSFGVILWEILTESVPFEGFTRKKLFQKIALEHYKPQIPAHIQENLSDLMKSCWNTDKANRPDFGLVVQNLAVRTTD